MKQKKKVISKILALLLSFAVIFSMMPGMALADGGGVSSTVPFTAKVNGVACTDVSVENNGYIYAGYNGDTAVDLYTVYIPAGTESVDLNLETASLVYNYKFNESGKQKDDDYLAGIVSDYTAGATEVTVDVDSNDDGVIDAIQVHNTYNADWSGGELRYAITFVYDDFKAYKGTSRLENVEKTGTYTYTDWQNNDSVVDLYTISIPVGTEEVKLELSKASLVYNYKFNESEKQKDDDYLAGIVSDSTVGITEVTVDVDSNNDGILDAIQIQNPYNADWSGGELRYAITFRYDDFTAVVDGQEMYNVTKVSDGYTGYGGTVDLYKVKVPQGTEKVTLNFNKNNLVYNYDAGGNYLAGWVDDYTVGSSSAEVDVDFDENGINDIIQVQNPYNADWSGGELLYAITFVTGNESATDPSDEDVSVPKISINGVGTEALHFYDPYGMECMLGNCWYTANELKAVKGETTESLKSSYKYLSAYVEVPEETKYTDLTVKWYYSDTYDVLGNGYKEVSTGGKETGVSGNIKYYNGEGWFDNTCFYNIYPDTTKTGTYYYYVVISDGTNTISSITSQAVVKISEASQTPSVPAGQISVNFSIEGFGSLPGLSARTVSVAGGSTAADLVKSQLTSNGYTYEWSSSMGGYLVGVTKYGITYSEFTAGPNSGWMYRVNGVAPQITLAGYTLQEGDEVVLYYTGDYTKDPYSTSGSTTAEPSISITDGSGNDASSMGSVKYDAETGSVEIVPSTGYKVTDVKVNGVSKGAVTSLSGIKATDKIEVVFEAETADEPAVSDQTEKIIAGVQATKIKVTNTKLKKGIKVYWKKNSGYKVSYYEVYRKAGKGGTYKKIYTTKLPTTLKITNVKNLKKGTTYYYKVRGVRVIDGKKYYTKWSNYTYRKY